GGTNHNVAAYSARVCSRTSDAAFGATAYAAPYLYVPCSDRLEALTVTTGATPSFASAWHGPATTFSTPPVVANNLVWTIDTNGLLSGLDGATGSAVWSADLGNANHFATPTADGGRLYVPAGTVVSAFSLSSWFAWEALQGSMTSGPAVASWASGRLDVFARLADGSLGHKWYNNGWSGWESLGGVLGGDPGAVSWAPGRIDTFVRGTDSQLWHRWYENGWSAWETLGGNIASGPAISSWASGRLDVFARLPDGSLGHKWYNNGWFNWETLGGQIADRPGAASWAVNRVDVLVEGTDSVLWHRWIS